MSVLDLGGDRPEVDPTAWVAPSATVVGAVSLGPGASVWYGAVLRGDLAQIVVGRGSNVQDGAVLHGDPGHPCELGSGVTVGHRAVVHGAVVEDDVLVGMGAVLLNGCRIGTGSVVGAGALVPEGTLVPPRSVVLGVPGRVRATTTDEQVAAIVRNGEVYVGLAARHRDGATPA